MFIKELLKLILDSILIKPIKPIPASYIEVPVEICDEKNSCKLKYIILTINNVCFLFIFLITKIF